MADVDPCAIRRLSRLARRILRCRAEAVDAASEILGLVLPRRAGMSASHGDRHALWLGPDEWLILADEALAERLARCAESLAALGAAFVDVSHRQEAIALQGWEAESWLASGCPLDLTIAAYPVGACTRTLFHKAEIVLWRRGDDCFHIEVWRSFAGYVESLLNEAASDLAAIGMDR